MTDHDGDPIDGLFSLPIRDVRRQAVIDHWWPLVKLHQELFGSCPEHECDVDGQMPNVASGLKGQPDEGSLTVVQCNRLTLVVHNLWWATRAFWSANQPLQGIRFDGGEESAT